MEDYMQKIIETALSNGLTLEQIMANPERAHRSYLESQLKAIDEEGEKVKNSFLSK